MAVELGCVSGAGAVIGGSNADLDSVGKSSTLNGPGLHGPTKSIEIPNSASGDCQYRKTKSVRELVWGLWAIYTNV